MRTKEERLLDVIGDTKDRNVLAAVGHENADPQMKTDVHHVEFREVPELPEKDLKRMRIRNAILGGFAAAAVIAGGIVLWKSLQNNTIGTNPAQQSSTEPVVTIYQPGGSDDVSVTAEDRFEQITDTSMPECGLDPWTEEYWNFTFPWRYEFAEVKDGFMKYIDPEKYIEWGEKAHIWEQGTPYRLEESHNVYSFIKFMGIPWESAVQALEETGFSEEEINTMKSDDIEKIIKLETSEYSVVIGEKVFSPRWLYYHTPEDYEKAGITVMQIRSMMTAYHDDLGLTAEAWQAFCNKLNGYIESQSTEADKRKYIIDTDKYDLTSDNAINVLNVFRGEWKRGEPVGIDDKITFSVKESPFDFEGFHRPIMFGADGDIWFMLCINSGEGEIYVIENDDRDVMYRTSPIYYNGDGGKASVDLSSDMCVKYTRESSLTETLRPREISVLCQIELFNIYGEDFEKFFRETLDNGYDSDYGKHYSVGGDMMTAGAKRYLVDRGDNFVTLGIRYFEEQEYNIFLDEMNFDAPPTEHYFAVTFRKDENGEWSVSYGEFDDVYADYPEFTIYSIKDTPYVAEFEMHDLELRGSSLLYQGGVVRLVDGADHSVLGEAPISTGLVGLNGYVCGKDTTIDYNVLADGGVLISIMLATEGQWLVPLYYYNGEKLVRVSESSSGGIADFQVSAKDWLGIEDDKIYITTSDDYVTGYTIDNGVLTQISREAPAYLSE